MVRTLYSIWIGLVLGGLLLGRARAETFNLGDGQTLTGNIVSYNENGLILRLPDDKYSDRVPWSKFSQADLKKFAQTPKMVPFVEPFIEVSQEERIKKTEVDIKTPERLARPEARSLLGALFSSKVGLFALVLLYAANLYAAYEVAVFRSHPRVLVCGLAAIPLLGVLAPIVFLSMPAWQQASPEDEGVSQAAGAPPSIYSLPNLPSAAVAEPAAEPGNVKLAPAVAGRTTSTLPATQVFQRGAYTFNRRFFETKFPGFFGMIRRDAQKDMVLLVKTARGEFIGLRIARIAANDLHLQVQKGPVSSEVPIPFTEIQEVQLKHKDA